MKRLGIAFSGGPTASEIVDCVGLAEDLGYESAWIAEGHGGDQFSILSGCAAATSKIKPVSYTHLTLPTMIRV